MKSRIFLACFALALPFGAGARDFELIHVQLRIFEADADAESGEQLLSAPDLLVQAGSWASVGAVKKLTFASEYAPPSLPEELIDFLEKKKKSANSVGPLIPPHPQTFDSRDLGLQLKIRPEIGEDGAINVEVQSERTALSGFVNYGSPISLTQNAKARPRVLAENRVLSPAFQTQKETVVLSNSELKLDAFAAPENVEFVEFADGLRSIGLPGIRIEVEASLVGTGLRKLPETASGGATEMRAWELTRFGDSAFRAGFGDPFNPQTEPPAAADVSDKFARLGIAVSEAQLSAESELKVVATPAALDRIDKIVALHNEGAHIYISTRFLETTAPIESEFAKPVMTENEAQKFLRDVNQQAGVEILSTPSVVTRGFQRAKIEVIREFIYPVSYEPPTIPEADEDLPPVTPANPDAFEVERVGVTFDVEEILIHEDRSIEMEIRPRVVEHLGFLDFGQPILELSKGVLGKTKAVHISENKAEVPVFGRREISSRFRVPESSWILLGGVVKTDKAMIQDKVPLLGDLPVVGQLARSETEIETDRFLYVLIRVNLIDPAGQPIAAVRTN